MKNKKSLVIAVMVAVTLLMATGYAYFSTRLNISGTSNIESNWKVVFTDITKINQTDGVTEKNTPTASGTSATFDVGLTSPGDVIEYRITVANQGSIDAIIESIDASDTGSDAIIFEVTNIKTGDLLLKGATTTFNVKISYKDSVSEQPNILINQLMVDINYVQNVGQSIVEETPAISSAQTYIANINSALKNSQITDGECIVSNDALNCDSKKLEVDGPSSGTVIISESKVQYVEGLNYLTAKVSSGFNGTLIESEYRQICKPVDENTRLKSLHYAVERISNKNAVLSTELSYIGNIPEGNYAPGDEYLCEVKPGTTYRFYVYRYEKPVGDISHLPDEIQKYAHAAFLIMDQNITSSGTPATSDDLGLVPWVTKADYLSAGGTEAGWDAVGDELGNTDLGPITAMNFLINATSDWINLPYHGYSYITGEVKSLKPYNEYPYEDYSGFIPPDPYFEYGSWSYNYNYISRATMISADELRNLGCAFEENVTNADGSVSKYYFNTCPLWISNNLQYRDIERLGANKINGIRGYWTLTPNGVGTKEGSPNDGGRQFAYEVYDHININSTYVYRENYNGVRPTITIPIYNIFS